MNYNDQIINKDQKYANITKTNLFWPVEKMSLGGNVSGVNASGKSVFWGNDKGPSHVP